MKSVWFLLSLSSLAACQGDVLLPGSGELPDPTCENERPATPSVTSPGVRAFGLVASSLELRGSDYADPEGVAPAGADWEIWTEAGGQLVTRVWSASVVDPALSVRLADGAFDSGFTGLSEWSDYVVRVRHRDAGTPCNRASEWSALSGFRTDDGSAAFFDEWQSRDIYLEFSAEAKAAMDAQFEPPGCVPFQRDFQPGNVIVDGVRFDGVGIKIKGGCGSARRVDDKASFKVNFNWDDPGVPGCPEKREIYGQRSLTLNNGVQDPSYARERLAYRVYRELGALAPRAAPVRVFVNGELFGLYLNVESVDRRFLAHRYDGNDGMLYEGTYYCDLLPENVPPGDTDDRCLTREFSPDACDTIKPDEDPQDYTLLRGMVQELADMPAASGFYAQAEALFDMDEMLATWAADSLLNHWDGFVLASPNNYRVYHDPDSDRWAVISTGVDQTFQTGRDENPFAVEESRFGTRCLADPDCKAAFAVKLRQARDAFAGMDLATHANKIHQQVGGMASEGKNVDPGGFDNVHNETLSFIGQRPGRIDQYLGENGF